MTGDDPRAELARLATALAAHVRRSSWLGRPLPRVDEARLAAVTSGAPADERSSAPPPPARPEARPAPSPPSPPMSSGLELDPSRPVEKSELAAAVERMRVRARGCADAGALRAAVAACTACPLAETRTQTVFSDGTGGSGVVFVGEAPGFHEDRQGVPFVGKAGQLLTDIIEKGMGLAREDVLICNVLKCRPPENRDPTGHEKALCTAWLDRQLELAGAKVIIALGRHAATHLLGSPASMARLRGRVHERRGAKVVATYHPAFLLRSPHMKRECWQDIRLAMRELGLEPPPRRRAPN